MPVEFHGCPAPYRESVEARFAERDLDVGAIEVLLVRVADDATEALSPHLGVEGRLVVAALERLSIDAYVEAFVAGAHGAVYIDTPSAITADVVEATLAGEVLLPLGAVQAMAALARRVGPDTALDDAEVGLLQALAAGRTVVDLANERFYSERTLRRHLQSLYLKIGVDNRAEAIAWATRQGVLG